MSIKQKQLDNVVEQILKEELAKGVLPNSRQFLLKLNNALREHKPGTPSAIVPYVEGHSKVDIDTYNNYVASVRDDLGILYSELIDSVNATLKNFNYFEVERKKIEYQIDKLKNELVNLLLVSDKSNQYVHTVFDTFADFDLVDKNQTTAEVNLGNNEVILSQKNNVSQKVDLIGTKVGFTLQQNNPSFKTSILGDINNIFIDTANNNWALNIQATEDQLLTGELLIELNQSLKANKLSVEFHSPKSTIVDVYYSPDNLNWFRLPNSDTKTIQAKETYMFHEINVAKLKLILTKPGSDTITYDNNSTQFNFVFGIKNLSLFNATYADAGTLRSIVHNIDKSNFTIDKVSLSVDEEKPVGTGIDYYLAFPSDDNVSGNKVINENNLNWVPISPLEDKQQEHQTIITLGNMSENTATLSIPSTISPVERELKQYNINGVKFYNLGEINLDGNIPASTLYRGKNAWKVESFDFTQPSGHIPGPSDWATIPSSATNHTTKYQNIDANKPSLLFGNVLKTSNANIKYTIAILMDSVKNIILRPTGNQQLNIAIYCNGQKAFTGSPKITDVSIKLSLGWNILQVFVYQPLGVASTLDIGTNILDYSHRIYAESTPLARTSLFNLQYNTLSSDYNSYVVEKLADKSRVIINHCYPDITYELFYSYVIRNDNNIIFKAELGRDLNISTLSPKLKSYQIRFM